MKERWQRIAGSRSATSPHEIASAAPVELRCAASASRNEAPPVTRGGRRWLVGERLSIADIPLLPYTRLARQGGFDLASRPAIREWIRACEAVLRFN
jgi:glutathione S-transferase